MDVSSISLLGLHQAATQNPGPTYTADERAEQSRLVQAVRAVNESGIFGSSDELQFSIDQSTKRPVIKLIDKDTRQVVRQIPPEYILRLAEDTDRIAI
jgi:flagellar protein FlaG